MSETIVTRYRLEVDDLVAEANKASNAVKGVGDDAAKSGKEASKSLKEVSAALKDNQEASRQLGRTIKEQEKLTNQWRQELVRAEAAQKNVGRGSKEYFQLQRAQNDLNRAIKENVQDIKGLRIDKSIVDGNIRDLKKQERQLEKNRKETERASKETSKFGKVLQNVGRFLLAAFAVDRIISGVRAVVRTISEYQSAVSELGGISGATDEQIQSLTRTARNFAKESQFTATQVVKAQTELAKLGRTVEEIEKTTEAVLLLATAAGTDVPNAAEIAAQTMNQFGIETEKAAEVTDIIAQSLVSSSLDIEKFRGAFKGVGTTASVVGATLAETAANVSALVDAGIPAEKAGTDLRNIYIALAEEGITWNEAQERLLNSTDKLATATDLFGRRSGAAGIVIAQNAEKIARLTGAYENAEGAAQGLADAQLDNLKGDQLLLTSAWEEFILSVEDGTSIVGRFFRNFTQNTAKLVNQITLLGDEQGTLAEQIRKDEELILRLRRDGNDVLANRIEQRLELRKSQLEELRLSKLTFEAKDDILIKEELSNEAVQDRIKSLRAEAERLKVIFADKNDIVDTDVRILFLQGSITKAQRDSLIALQGTLEERRKLLAQIEKENAAASEGTKITEEQLAAQRALRADQIALRVAEQERNNAIINDNLEAEKAALEEANRLAEESGNQNIRQRLANSKRIEEINHELLQSDLRLATVREDAKRAEIALLNSIENKTPAIQAQIFGAEEDLVRLSRAVDDILLKLATGGGESFTRELAPDIDFSEGIGDMPIEQVEEALLGMYGRLQVSYEDLAKRTREIQQENLHLMLTDQEAWEMAVKESTGRVAEYRSQAALSYLNAITGVFNQVLAMEKQQAGNSRELTLFTIGLNTATAIAGAVSSAANLPFPANIPAIAAAISAALAGIAQARQALEPTPSLRSFEGGGATSPTSRTGGVDGKGGFNAILHPKEYVIDSLNPEKGLKDMFADKKLAGIISRWSFKDRLDVASSSHTTINNTKSSNWSDSRMVRELKNSVELQALAVQEMRKLSKSNRFKRAGAG